MSKMTNAAFVAKLKDISKNVPTVYAWGTFGQFMSESLIQAKKKQYPNYYTTTRITTLRKAIGTKFAFDCVGLIKGVLWDWSGDKKATNGGAKYESNNVPDIDANTMIGRCSGVSTNFSKIEIGEAVWIQGHIGVYIGDGLVIECTPGWKDGVQITALENIGKKSGYNSRKWTKHGKLPYVEYVKEDASATPKTIAVGSRVRLSSTADKYYPGGSTIPAWVKTDYDYEVKQILSGGKKVIKGGKECVLLGKKIDRKTGKASGELNTWVDRDLLLVV